MKRNRSDNRTSSPDSSSRCELAGHSGCAVRGSTFSDQLDLTVDEVVLRSELRCPVCLRIMRDPVATECLHRFCKDCIERCQRQAQKYCPSCRTPIATRRSLRPDPNIAALIQKLYPDVDAFEAEQERQIVIDNAALIKEHSQKMKLQLQRQKERQAQYELDAKRGKIAARVEYEQHSAHWYAQRDGRQRRGGRAVPRAQEASGQQEVDDDDDDDDDEYGEDDFDEEEPHPESSSGGGACVGYWAQAGYRIKGGGAVERDTAALTPRCFELGFRLNPHPLEKRLPQLLRDFVVTSCLATVHHLQAFLCHQYEMEEEEHEAFQLHAVLPHSSSFPALQPDASLHEIIQQYQLDSASLEFRFRYTGSCG